MRIAKPKHRTIIDVLAHYLIAFWILVMFYFLLNLKAWFHLDPWFPCAGIALLMIPVRLFALHLVFVHKRDKYLKKIMDELINEDHNS